MSASMPARKYDNLPPSELGEEAEFYETPELTEDTSTIPAPTTPRSRSPTSDYDDDYTGIDRRGLTGVDARARFEPSQVDARGVDFSDSLNAERRSYRTDSRRRRRSGGGTDYGDFSDEEDESLERRLARLRREVEEVKMEYEQRKNTEKKDGESQATEEDPQEGINQISEILDQVYIQRHGGLSSAEEQYARTLQRYQSTATSEAQPPAQLPTNTATQQKASLHDPALALTQAATFDTRLTLLESTLGLSGKTMPDSTTSTTTSQTARPILPTLEALDQQFAALTSTAALDAARTRVRDLVIDAERLDELRRAHASETRPRSGGTRDPRTNFSGVVNGRRGSPAGEMRRLGSSSGGAGLGGIGPGADTTDPTHTTKLNALYGTLPTIASLAPSLPLVLERLRTLRLLHASAATASQTLDEVERRQGEQANEIAEWREAVGKVEGALKEGEEKAKGNVEVVGKWVRELEGRVRKFK
ncbi:hypothetical protein K402DRAFT_431618 [Aulographum hederae CBS 113979]|uniref:Dynamitin-domain-containing protein n=1 Tax=Aulographum hederae CBS 113979 TaxID=1176131 RepID=A0A6G1GZ63_9PEZI|nr:hypothetical protein K402DRAFT_431618 [Aulographum hederae CBS 113979]